MLKSASFRFYGTLNDFLPGRRKNSWVRYEFYIAPTIKDAIESMEVPHPEVDLVLVNNAPVDFQYHLENNDTIEVYPLFHKKIFPAYMSLSGNHLVEEKFILDVHLGALAKALRMLGFDARYENNYDDKTIVRIAMTENRTVLTRDIHLLKHKIIRHGYWIRSQQPLEQIKEVVHYFSLRDKFKPFERCLECNGRITAISIDAVKEKVPLQISQDYHEFFQCNGCSRVYWKGSHYDKMKLLIERLRKDGEG